MSAAGRENGTSTKLSQRSVVKEGLASIDKTRSGKKFNFNENAKRKFLLITDCQNDGSFLIHHFLSLSIKGGFKVLFVALVQSFSHYSKVAQKLGINLSSICESGQVTYIDGLSCISEALADERQQDTFKNSQSSTLGNKNSDRSNPFINVRAQTFTLQPLYNRIKSSLGDETKPCLLLIDDLTGLLSIGVHLQQITNFIHYCAVLMCHLPTVVCNVTKYHFKIFESCIWRHWRTLVR
ncbi:elongator complex protein 6-like [Stylophora pistillata]|uniref:elongator complex protein 6-like n=1 Tax=Stylophora pistillata TaxID=50429 RepID=UPI000C044E75|nr:elongator complex protein 6-like [Stylophora pistillata]